MTSNRSETESGNTCKTERERKIVESLHTHKQVKVFYKQETELKHFSHIVKKKLFA